MSVAESIVIFGPICQVGCLRASSGVTSVQLACASGPGTGPPEEVRMTRRTSWRSPAWRAWKIAECSLSTGKIVRPAAAGQVHDQRTGDDQRLLVGQGDGLAGLERRPGPAQADRPHDRAQDPVGLRVLDHPDDPVPPGQHLDFGPAELDPKPLVAFDVGHGDESGPDAIEPARRGRASSCARSGPRPGAACPASCSITLSVLLPIEPVEPRITTRVGVSPGSIKSSHSSPPRS